MTRALRIAVLAACLAPIAAAAEIGTLDDVPGATLLLPYFEVDLANPNGAQTVFSIHNAGAAPIEAHVTMWTDVGIPVLAFDVHLLPFDVEEIDLREVFEGRFPNAGTRNCTGEPTAIAGSLADAIAGTTGQPLARLGGLCAGSDHGDGAARGYMTIDAIPCAAPAGAGQARGIIGPQQVDAVWGDYRLVHRQDGVAVGEPLVAIERAPDTGFESLPQRWGARYIAALGAVTDLIVWRDVPLDGAGYQCGPAPTTPPVGGVIAAIVAFSDSGSSFEPTDGLPALTAARVRVGTDLTVPFMSGWIFLDLARLGGTGGYVTTLQLVPPLGMAIRAVDLSATTASAQ